MGGDKKEKTGLEKIKQLNKQYKELNEELKKLHSKVELAVNLKRDIDKYNRNHEEKRRERKK